MATLGKQVAASRQRARDTFDENVTADDLVEVLVGNYHEDLKAAARTMIARQDPDTQRDIWAIHREKLAVLRRTSSHRVVHNPAPWRWRLKL